MADTTFNPETAYADDWRYMDRVKDGVMHERDAKGMRTGVSSSVKCVKQSVAETDLAAQAANLGLAPSDTVLTVWRVSATDPVPLSGWSIISEGIEWIIGKVIELTFGPKWQCIVSTPLNKGEFNQT